MSSLTTAALSDRLDRRWQVLVTVNIVVLAGHLLYKLRAPVLDLGYVHLLVDYHFGIIKRGLLGAALALAVTEVSPLLAKTVGTIAIVLAFALYLRLFRATFGFTQAHATTFVFTVGSPFFFKNFVYLLGYLDIYGCICALALLLLPARRFLYVVVAAAGALALILIHHLHALLYVPTLIGIVLIRYYARAGCSRRDAAAGAILLLGLVAATAVMQFRAIVSVDEAQFGAHLRSRMTADAPLSALAFTYVWYRPLSAEIADTWRNLADHWRYWYIGYPALALLHVPLAAFGWRIIRAIARADHRLLVVTILATVTLGYVLLLCIAFDNARFVSNWAVCMILLGHAAWMLPGANLAAPIAAGSHGAFWLGVPLSLLPRVGGIRPFSL